MIKVIVKSICDNHKRCTIKDHMKTQNPKISKKTEEKYLILIILITVRNLEYFIVPGILRDSSLKTQFWPKDDFWNLQPCMNLIN